MKPAKKNRLTGKQFFLVRQTANLMEDFVREISSSSSLFLLYGDDSVGKSWLLRELTSKRFAKDSICWIDFKSDGSGIESKDTGLSQGQGPDASDVSELMEGANDGDLIVVDHFELASNKARHALFQSWVTDGKDKKLNLILTATSGSFNEVRQLAQQYHLEVKSFQLLPYSTAEVEAFLGFYLFPDNPFRPLSVPAEVLKQIKNCKGVIGWVAEVAAQQRSRITQEPEAKPENNGRLVVGVMLSLLLLVAVAYGYLQFGAQGDMTDKSQSEADILAVPEQEQSTAIDPQIVEPTGAIDTVESLIDSTVTAEPVSPEPIADQNEPVQTLSSNEAQTNGEASSGADAEIVADSQSTSKTDAEQESISQLSPSTDTNPDQLAESTAVEQLEPAVVATETESMEKLLGEARTKYSARFQQDLENSLHWIRQNDKKRTTIQIMSLGFSEFTDDTYYWYIEKLKKQNIDISSIRVYPTRINGSVVYGVIYGDYGDRKEANEQIRQLPEDLRINQPIPRTIGGIWNEING